MFAFRFKVTFEDNDSFLREIDLAANQTFEELHNIITEDLKLDNTKEASVFLCDHQFRKKQEISSGKNKTDFSKKSDDEHDREESEQKNQAKGLAMKEHAISDLIDDPHQRLMYVFDYTKNWTFYIELIKIFPVNSSGDFPMIVKRAGRIPRELVPKPQTPSDKNSDNNNEEQLTEPEQEDDSFLDIMEDNIEDGFDIKEEKPEDDSLDRDEPEDDKY